MFLKDRAINQREKDLLKAVKDEQLARNIPGKVKLSAPKLQNLKKQFYCIYYGYKFNKNTVYII